MWLAHFSKIMLKAMYYFPVPSMYVPVWSKQGKYACRISSALARLDIGTGSLSPKLVDRVIHRMSSRQLHR